MDNAHHTASPRFIVRADDSNRAEMELSGAWCGDRDLPDVSALRDAIAQHATQSWRIVSAEDFSWDSACMTRLFVCVRYCDEHNIELDISALPHGMRKLLEVATAVKPQQHASTKIRTRDQWRNAFKNLRNHFTDLFGFTGGVVLAFLNLLSGRSYMRMRDFFYFFQQCGAQALGIVALISVLVGMILAYLGAVQLRQFGAEVYIANLVAIGAVREMGPLMTAVIMAGRTGAAFAAQLGSMQANEEIDAVTTLGISPLEYLVLPRMLALLVAMPLLCIFADALCLLGGALVATSMDVSSVAFIFQARSAVDIQDIASGIIKGLVFAVLIATAGCQAGLQSGRSADAVGRATTRAVVNAIVYLVIADAALNIAYDRLNF